MFRIILLPVFFLCFIISGFGQVIGIRQEQYLHLYSGDTLNSDSITYQSISLAHPVFNYADGKSVVIDSVEYFGNFHGNFANLRKVQGKQTTDFGLRIRKGTVNIFEEVDIEIYGGRHLAIQSDHERLSQHPELATGDNYDYYNINGGPIKKVSYRNLLLDVNTNENSAKELRAFKRYRYLQIGLIGAGAGVAAASILMQTGVANFNPITATGIIVAGCSFFVRYPKRDALKNAIDFYNE